MVLAPEDLQYILPYETFWIAILHTIITDRNCHFTAVPYGTVLFLARMGAENSKTTGVPVSGAKDAVEAWEQVVAAMSYEEGVAIAAEKTWSSSRPALSIYWAQNCVGCTAELPFRIVFHSCCAGTWMCCLAIQPSNGAIGECATHHVATASQYQGLANLLVHNLLHPDQPHWIYRTDTRLKRPPDPRPTPAGNGMHQGDDNCCACQGCCRCTPDACDACCMELDLLLNRELRSLLCIFSCASALHPGRCTDIPTACASLTRGCGWRYA